MIKNIKHLHPELDVELLRNSLDLVILEHREIQIGDTWANQDVAACVASQVEALQWQRRRAAYTGRLLIAVRSKKGHVGCRRDSEALCLDVIIGIAGICKGAAPRSAKPVRVRKIVATKGIGRFASSAQAPDICPFYVPSDCSSAGYRVRRVSDKDLYRALSSSNAKLTFRWARRR
jgi:hypothetical protein